MRSSTTWFLLLGVLLLSVAANAATTPVASCTPFPAVFNNGAGGPTAVACPAFTVPGGTITGVALAYAADYQFGGTANTVVVTFAPAGPSGVTWSNASLPLSVSGGTSSGSIPTAGVTATGGVTTAKFQSAFNVNVSSSVTAGTVATSSGAVSVVYTYDPPPQLTLVCPASTGVVGTPYNSALLASGGVPPDTFSITSGSMPPGLTLNSGSGAITGVPTTPGAFNFGAKVTDSIGTQAGTTPDTCTITISDIPHNNTCGMSAAAVVFPTAGVIPENAFLVRYAANLDKGDSVINVTNSGLNGAPLLGPGYGGSIGDICINVYTFSPDEQLASCCSCQVTPNGLASFSVNNDLLSTTLTGVIPTSVVVKLVASIPGTGTLAGGMLAWGTSLHPVTPAGPYRGTETPFRPATLSAGELASITGRCASILGNGSGFGVCPACRTGALGGAKKP